VARSRTSGERVATIRKGFRWWELDVTYYSLQILSKLGIVWDLRQPPNRAPDVSWREQAHGRGRL